MCLIFTWLNNFLWTWLSSYYSKPDIVLVLGLDDSGKTLLIQQEFLLTSPTIKPSIYTMKINSRIVNMIDTNDFRQIQNFLYNNTSDKIRLIFMFDASNCERLSKARDELLKIIHNNRIRHLPLLILANKIDKINTIYNETELRDFFRIEHDNSRIKFYMCSIKHMIGYINGLEWLINKEDY